MNKKISNSIPKYFFNVPSLPGINVIVSSFFFFIPNHLIHKLNITIIFNCNALKFVIIWLVQTLKKNLQFVSEYVYSPCAMGQFFHDFQVTIRRNDRWNAFAPLPNIQNDLKFTILCFDSSLLNVCTCKSTRAQYL